MQMLNMLAKDGYVALKWEAEDKPKYNTYLVLHYDISLFTLL